MSFFYRWVHPAVVLWLLGCASLTAEVVVNELMFHAAPAVPEDPRKEWIELSNRGTNAVDLNGWRFTKGISFGFTNMTLPAGGYLVVAADVATFQTDYPGITNVVGGWTGKLSNNGERIELTDAFGQVAASLEYVPDGDWAALRVGDAYSGQPTWWRGWGWTNAADGMGCSMELVSPDSSSKHGQNWSVSAVVGGTPGGANSTATNDIAPMILEVRHYPPIPRSTNTVTITARVVDELSTNLTVQLSSRGNGDTNFAATNMFDDGTHGDGVAGDGYFGAVLPASSDKMIVEFYIRAIDAAGHSRTWPSPTDTVGTQGANALYQVDDSSYAGNQSVYRLIITTNEWSQWLNLQDVVSNGRYSEAAMNATLVRSDGMGTEIRYNVLVRNRGAGTRAAHPHNFRINIPADRPLQGMTEIDLNTRTVHAQVAGNALFSLAGLPNAYGAPVQVRVNSVNLANAQPNGTTDSYQFGSYFCFEPYSADWADHHLPNDPQGNLYKGVWYQDNVQLTNGAVLDWRGTNVANYRFAYAASGPTANSGPYSKQSNKAEDDWSDLINLCSVLNLTPSSNYAQVVNQVVNVDEWLGYFAANALVLNMETTLATGTGDDYSMYCGVNEPRFQLLNHDLDTVLGQGDATPSTNRSVFKAGDIATVNRFLKDPAIAPLYYRTLFDLANRAFAASNLNATLDQVLGGWVPETYIRTMKDVAAARRTAVLAQIPMSLSVTSAPALTNGYPRTTAASVSLAGLANAIETSSVKVNGRTASYTPWQGSWSISNVALMPGINRILVQALNTSGAECARTNFDVWYDDGSVQAVGGTITGNATWTAVAGPYSVTTSLTIASNVTLTIEAGTTVYLSTNVNFTVADGGRLLAEGMESAPIRFTAAPGSGGSWGNLTIDGSVGSPESRIAYAHFASNGVSPCIEVAGGTVWLDHTSFGNTARQYLALDGASFVVSHCVFPTATAAFELVHGTAGIKTDGRGIIRDCFFGAANGYNDVIDFTGGNRDFDQPIVQFYNNVFIGSGDDGLDLDGTDAWIEGNIFLHIHKNGSPDSSSAVSGGNNGADTSEITLVRNLIFDCDQAVTAKQRNFYTLLNNTIVRTTKTGGLDTESAVVNLDDEGTTYGVGCYLEGNIIIDAEELVRSYTDSQALVTFTNNLMPLIWTGPGGGNSTNDARLKYIPQNSEVNFTSWEQAQILWDWFSLEPGSPARGTGPNHQDMGAVIPSGASLFGEPLSPTVATNATLTVGSLRKGNGMPTAGFPQGSGYTHYKHRLDGGGWSTETPIATPIVLSGLTNGPHQVEVIGRRDSGWYQDAGELGEDATVTTSRTWVVNTALNRVLINEVLADNSNAWWLDDTTPDAIELYNPDILPVDLSGMGLTDDPASAFKFTFPPGTLLGGGRYLVLVADNGSAGTNLHTGFKLDKDGGSVSLFAAPANGGGPVDSVSYGLQLTDLSIGRLDDGSWALTQPTLGRANVPEPTGGLHNLRLNEWLAASLTRDDFVELYNGDDLPVDIGGCHLSEVPDTLPAQFQIAPLSFIAAKGELTFIADGNAQKGPRHLNFSLAQEWGTLGLFAPDLTPLDRVLYGPQTAEVSMGRTPNGGNTLTTFTTPTPGAGNPGSIGSCTVSNLTLSLMTYTQAWRYNQSNNLNGIAWYAINYNESTAAWQGPGRGLLAYEANSSITPLTNTWLISPSSAKSPAGSAYYFRTTLLVTNDLADFTVTAKARIDDGAIIYVNGVEISTRIRMNSGTIYYTNLSSALVQAGGSGDATVDDVFTIPTSYFIQGTNVIAAEVHQNSTSSSDIVWGMTLEAVRYITNCTTPTAVLNEVLANNGTLTNSDGSVTDWVELANPSSLPLSMVGMSLTDDPAKPGRWVFPAGVVLEGSNHLVIRFDGSAPGSFTNGPVLNSGFGLKTAGGAVYLFDAGGALLDGINYGLQAADFSIARVPNASGSWTLSLPTPGSANIATTLGDGSALRINEWAANVSGGPDWFELFNPNPQPVALAGLYLTDKLSNRTKHLIAPLSYLGVGNGGFATFVADNDTAQGPNHVNFTLDADGESLGLFTATSATAIDSVTFGTQTANVSEGRLPDGGAVRVFFTNSTPGEPNWLPLPNVEISEVLSHTDPPLEDAIKLQNTSDTTVDISGWWLSDTKENLRKFSIPAGKVLAPRGYLVFYQYQFEPTPGTGNSFEFSSALGDSAWLSEVGTNGQLTGYRAHVKFGPQFNGVSFGAVPTSAGVDFVALQSLSFGTSITAASPADLLPFFRTGAGVPNSPPRVGPIVISEIMYRPPPLGTNDNIRDEFVELYNLTAATVPLFDPEHATNGWRLRGGVDFDFNTRHSLAPGGFLLLVSFDPATNVPALTAFRAVYGTNGVLVGPFNGKLANAGEALELYAPDKPETSGPEIGLVPYVLMERVSYGNTSPWPTNADGLGQSLQRITFSAYGNDPTNWSAAVPTAGFLAGGDTDGDGMPDAWEDAHGLNKFVNDAALDPDHDGFSNLQEYVAGTDPQNDASALAVLTALPNAGGTDIRFEAVAGRTYSILHASALLDGDWQKLTNLPPQAVTAIVTVHDSAVATTNRFYRLVTPALP